VALMIAEAAVLHGIDMDDTAVQLVSPQLVHLFASVARASRCFVALALAVSFTVLSLSPFDFASLSLCVLIALSVDFSVDVVLH
jgi:hypothetical protein